MRRPQGKGLVALGIALAIIFLWTAHASAIIVTDISIVEPDPPGPDPSPGPVRAIITRTNTTTMQSQTQNVTGGAEDIQFSITSFGTAPIGNDIIKVIFMNEPAPSIDLSDVVKLTLGGTTSTLLAPGTLLVQFVSDGSSHFSEFSGLTPNVTRNEPVGGFLNLTTDVQAFGGAFATNTHLFQVQSEAPEPGTLFLLGSGLVGVGTLWRRRRHS